MAPETRSTKAGDDVPGKADGLGNKVMKLETMRSTKAGDDVPGKDHRGLAVRHRSIARSTKAGDDVPGKVLGSAATAPGLC